MPNDPFTPVQKGFDAQAGRFFHIMWNGVIVGGAQNVQYSEATGVADFVGEIGSDYREPDYTMRQVSGTIEKLALNRRKFRDIIIGQGDSSNTDIDFRQFYFTLVMQYNEQFINFQGKPLSPATGNGVYSETLNNVMFQNISCNLSNPQTLSRESVSFIGWTVGLLGVTDSAIMPRP